MFKVAALGIATTGFHTEPMKNSADFNKFFHRYKQVLIGPCPRADMKPGSLCEITSTVEYEHSQNTLKFCQVILPKCEIFTAKEHRIS